MPSQAVPVIKAKVIRVTKLDSCGIPVTGASGARLVTKSFTSVQVSPDYEEGEEFLTKLADGTPCVNQKDPSFLKRAGLENHFCTLDPDLISIITGETEIFTGSGPVTGTGMFFGSDVIDDRFSLELWQPVAGRGRCDASGLQRYVYWAFPNVTNAMIQDFTFENAVFDFVISAETDEAHSLWYTRMGSPAWLDGTAFPEGKHFGFNVTTTAPPDITAGAVTF